MANAIVRADLDSGDWILCCPPELESRIYVTNMDTSIWQRIPDIVGPLMFICSDPEAEDASLTGSDTNGGINLAAGEALGFPCVAIPDTTHMLQIEKPEACVDEMERFLDGIRVA